MKVFNKKGFVAVAAVALLAARPPLAWGLGRAGWRFAHGLSWSFVVQQLLDALLRVVAVDPRHAAALAATLVSLPFTQLRRNRYFYLYYDGFYVAFCLTALAVMAAESKEVMKPRRKRPQ